MANYYLISSLPMLEFDTVPIISSKEFMEQATTWYDEDTNFILETLSLVPTCESTNSVIKKWNEWETFLRNKLTLKRSSDLSVDAEEFLREDKDFFSEVEKGIQEVASLSSPRDKEMALDKLRWQVLEDLDAGFTFEFEKLCVYKLKLLILEKWQNRSNEIGKEEFDKIVKNVYGTQES